MILFMGRSAGRWAYTLRKLVAAWKRGETTVLFTPDHFILENKSQ